MGYTTVSHKRPESVLVVIYSPDADVLLLQRHDNPAFWQSVTGSLEPGETPMQAAVRELAEETDLTGQVVDHHHRVRFAIRGPWRVRYAPEVTHNIEHRFSVCVDRQVAVNIDPEEHDACCWLPFDEALERASSPTNVEALRMIVPAATGRATVPAAGAESGCRWPYTTLARQSDS